MEGENQKVNTKSKTTFAEIFDMLNSVLIQMSNNECQIDCIHRNMTDRPLQSDPSLEKAERQDNSCMLELWTYSNKILDRLQAQNKKLSEICEVFEGLRPNAN